MILLHCLFGALESFSIKCSINLLFQASREWQKTNKTTGRISNKWCSSFLLNTLVALTNTVRYQKFQRLVLCFHFILQKDRSSFGFSLDAPNTNLFVKLFYVFRKQWVTNCYFEFFNSRVVKSCYATKPHSDKYFLKPQLCASYDVSSSLSLFLATFFSNETCIFISPKAATKKV